MKRACHPDPWEVCSLSAWILVFISTPIVSWISGYEALGAMISLGVCVQTASVGILLMRQGVGRTTIPRALLILPIALAVEYAGYTTGYPFGSYRYTEALQPQLWGVPVLIPLAWTMMLIPSWGIAMAVVRGGAETTPWRTRLMRAGVAALAFTAWDLFLDPQMVSWGFWIWENPGAYFGIPLANYLGWMAVSFILSFLLMPDQLPIKWMVFIYTITWFLQSFGLAFFWRMPGPAICGFLGMGSFILWAYARRKEWM